MNLFELDKAGRNTTPADRKREELPAGEAIVRSPHRSKAAQSHTAGTGLRQGKSALCSNSKIKL